jgi:hypothetical protein
MLRRDGPGFAPNGDEAAALRKTFHRDADTVSRTRMKSNATGHQEPASLGGNDDQQSD